MSGYETTRLSHEYVAGFFDGEGSVGLYRDRYNFRPYVAITLKNDSRNIAVLQLLADRYGSTVYRSSRTCRVQFSKGSVVRRFINDILPYTIIKTTQLILLDSWLETKTYGFRIHQQLKSHKRRE